MSTLKTELTPITPSPEDLPGDLLDLVLDEVERALFLVDAREDEPGHRRLTGDAPIAPDEAIDERPVPSEVAELRLAIAELVDAHPSMHRELERVSERARSLGATAGAVELGNSSQLLDLSRLSLETFFRFYPELAVYESAHVTREYEDDSGRGALEIYESLSQVLAMFRSRLS